MVCHKGFTDCEYAYHEPFKCLLSGDAQPSPPPPGHFRIYGMRFCPYTERVLIYLAKKKIKAEIVNINLKDKPDWLKKVHPEEKVPALEHDGKVLVESTIIVQYLDELFPETSVLPKDPYERAVQRMLFERTSSFTAPLFKLLRTKSGPYGELHDKLEKDLVQVEPLLKNTFFGGNKPGFTDYLIFPIYERLAVFANHPEAGKYNLTSLVGTERFPHLTHWYEKMCSLPQVSILMFTSIVIHD
ncbi:unnamed protein product [Toxocara canis]|uniref:Glutathione S-transferase omega n=1 Tax=Toxocara canis TaxID=6265 RepID=A0A183UYL2_TOXCA|nr:unnamed protein product [Toxocara canis]